MIDLSIEISGICFKNPVMNAAGPAGRDGNALKVVAAHGAGGLVTKTISDTPAKVPRPCLAILDRRIAHPKGLLNVETWSDIPYRQWVEKELKIALETGLPLIASVGYLPEQIKKIADLIENCGVHAIEFSTHYLGKRPIVEVAKVLKEEVDIPVFAKLSPQGAKIAMFAKAAEKAGVDGIVAINSFGPCLHIDITTGKPYLGGENGYGWISGPALKPLAIRCVAEVARTVRIPVIGVGGVMSGEDAVEHFMAGATAVQICTGAILEGPSIYSRVVKEIEEFMKKNGYSCIGDIRGIALKHLPKEVLRTHSVSPKVDEKKCTGCGVCIRTCVYNALALNKGIKKTIVSVDGKKCYGCGLCVSLCPVHAITFGNNCAPST